MSSLATPRRLGRSECANGEKRTGNKEGKEGKMEEGEVVRVGRKG